MRYIVDDPEITGPGKYTYRWVKQTEMAEWLNKGPWSVRVNNDAVAEHLRSILNQEVSLNRTPRWVMNPGDEGLVVRKAVGRESEGLGKGQKSPDTDDERWEYGIIKRIE